MNIQAVFQIGRVLPFVLLLAVGCGQSNPLSRQAIGGRVTFDGAPLDQGTISFSPEAKGSVGGGATIKNGVYAIPAVQGLPPGKYIVRINSIVPNTAGKAKMSSVPTVDGPNGPGIERIAAAYNMASKITIEVVAGRSSEFSFEAKSK